MLCDHCADGHCPSCDTNYRARNANLEAENAAYWRLLRKVGMHADEIRADLVAEMKDPPAEPQSKIEKMTAHQHQRFKEGLHRATQPENPVEPQSAGCGRIIKQGSLSIACGAVLVCPHCAGGGVDAVHTE